MSFTSFFHSFGHTLTSTKTAQETELAGVAIAAFNPGIGALVEMIAGAAYAVETKAANATASGSDKKDQVKQIIDVAAPVALATLASVTGKPAPDAAAIAPSIDSLIDLVVGLLNALGVFAHKTAPAAAVIVPAGVPSAHPAA